MIGDYAPIVTDEAPCTRGCGRPVRFVFLGDTSHVPESLCLACADLRTDGWGARLGGC